jgi:cytochrome P450
MCDRFGFLDAGQDIQGVMASISQYLNYAVRVGIFSEWHRTLFRYYLRSKKLSGLAHVRDFARQRLEARLEKAGSSEAVFDPSAPADFITKFLRIRASDATKISKEEIALTCSTNIGAGSDTTSISLSAIIFYLYKFPETLSTLRQEIKEMAARGMISDPVTFQEAQQMPYLQAVIKEALRLHPATGLILGRVVPKGGAQLAGQYFPEGVSNAKIQSLTVYMLNLNPLKDGCRN